VTGRRLRFLAAALLLVATALFAIGVSLERRGDDHRGEEASEQTHHGEEEVSRPDLHAERELADAHDETTILGINAESTGAVTSAVVVSLLLAAAIAVTRSRLVLIATVFFGLAFALLDVAEMLHQLNNAEVAVGLLAAAVGTLHLGSSGASGASLSTHPKP
jgi:hypothetical protein